MEKRASVVVVTGGGRGIGRAVCRKFAQSGWQVVAISRTQGDLEETASIVSGESGRCAIRAADVTDLSAVSAAIEHTVAEHGRIDALINCAGVAPVAGVEALTPDESGSDVVCECARRLPDVPGGVAGVQEASKTA